jgi:hypothetical protein
LAVVDLDLRLDRLFRFLPPLKCLWRENELSLYLMLSRISQVEEFVVVVVDFATNGDNEYVGRKATLLEELHFDR